MHIRVSGDLRPEATLHDVSVTYHPSWNPFAPGEAVITYRLLNVGNTRITAAEDVQGRGLAGIAPFSHHGEDTPELIREASVSREIHVRVWPVFYESTDLIVMPLGVGLARGTASTVHEDVSFWAIPWSQLLLLLLVVVGFWLLARWRIRRGDQET
jgi:hypothetical protein